MCFDKIMCRSNGNKNKKTKKKVQMSKEDKASNQHHIITINL